MRWGGLLLAAPFLACLVPQASSAQVSTWRLLRCAAEFEARAEYGRALGQITADHSAFLATRADILLRMAEGPSATNFGACREQKGVALGLVYCPGPQSLSADLEDAVANRLVELVLDSGGSDRLPVCMEDESCSACLRLISEIERREAAARGLAPSEGLAPKP